MEELKLTVYFEDPFWVGVFERTQNGTLSVCKITFGAEPKDYAVHAYVLRHFYELCFSPVLSARQHAQCSNPKRRQRQVQKQLSGAGIGTKSMQALAAQREQLKTERKQQSRTQQEAEQQRRFEQKQRKKLEKHKGH